jgi:tetratricopeptide (TPR) repeat protein
LRKIHYLSLTTAIGLIALLYWGVNTIPPAKAPANNAATGQHDDHDHNEPGHSHQEAVLPATTDSIIAASRKALPAHAMQELAANESKINSLTDSTAMVPLMEEQSKLWQEHKLLPMAAILRSRAAYLAHSEKKLNFAGQFYMELLQHEGSPSMQMWEAQQAIDCFNGALAINPDNDTTKLALASGYIDGTREVMKGVAVLQDITRKDPNHIPANLVLGRMSIQSGQFDKAVGRFETILKLEPENREALYFLAEAYKGKGNTAKAKELFEQCKKLVNNPEFSKEIDNYIKSF